MSDESAAWYIRGSDNQPEGPCTAERLIKRLQAGKLDARTVCWRKACHNGCRSSRWDHLPPPSDWQFIANRVRQGQACS